MLRKASQLDHLLPLSYRFVRVALRRSVGRYYRGDASRYDAYGNGPHNQTQRIREIRTHERSIKRGYEKVFPESNNHLSQDQAERATDRGHQPRLLEHVEEDETPRRTKRAHHTELAAALIGGHGEDKGNQEENGCSHDYLREEFERGDPSRIDAYP